MGNVSDKDYRQKQKIHFMSDTFFLPENREKMLKNGVQPGKPQLTIWCLRVARWIPNATNTHSQYVIPTAFPLQQWLYVRASMLCYTQIACPVCSFLFLLCNDIKLFI